jgi:beta-glucanase (GH16 family)
MMPLPRIRLLLAGCIALHAAIAVAQSSPDHGPANRHLDPTANWVRVDASSDEFDAGVLNTKKWDHDPKDWGTWSWEPDNAYLRDGMLRLRMAYAPHTRGKEKLFLTSGIVKSRVPITYGYFEARIKAASVLPGTCPAFWMKGDGPGRQNCEIDFMELRESAPLKLLATNLHAHVDVKKNGRPEWMRENRSWPMPWDPRNEFHLYACEVTPEKIVWYVDGEKVNEAPNTHWHFPMYVMLSLGVRTPYRTFENPAAADYPEGHKNYPAPERTIRDRHLFPTEMIVDYVCVWERRPR